MEALKEAGLSIKGPFFKPFYTKIIWLYVRRYLGFEPTPPASREMRLSPCACVDCAVLNTFLRDPKRSQMDFRMVKKRRQHLESQMAQNTAVECRTQTGTSPCVLWIEKYDKKYIEELSAWRTRKATLLKEIEALGKHSLRSLFGVTSSADVLGHCDIASALVRGAPAPLSTLMPASTNSQSAPTVAEGTAQSQGEPSAKASGPEIVDLT